MKIAAILFILFFTLQSSFAQGVGSLGSANPVAAAMGNTAATTSRGVYALGTNPANLALKSAKHGELQTIFPFPNLSLTAGTNFFSISDLNYYFGGVQDENGNLVGRQLSDSDKQNLIDLFGGNQRISSSMTLNFFSLALRLDPEIGSFAVNFSDRMGLKARIPQDILNFALYGNPLNSTYSFNGLELQAYYLRDYSLSYARKLPELNLNFLDDIAVGITVKYVQGFAYAGVQEMNTSITTMPNSDLDIRSNALFYTSASPTFGVHYGFEEGTEESRFGFFPEAAGSGIAFDLGLNVQVNSYLSAALSVVDLGSVSWEKETAAFETNTSLVNDDVTNQDYLDSLENSFTEDGYPIGAFSTQLPTVLRLGVAFQADQFFRNNIPGLLLLAADYTQGFNEMPFNTTRSRFSTGFEWRPFSWFPLRSGLSFGGLDGFNWGLGFGFNIPGLELNFSTSHFNSIVTGNDVKKLSVSLGSRWRF